MRTQDHTAEQVIAAIKESFGIKTAIAARLGCSRTTVNNYIERYPTVRRAWQDERGRFVDMAQSKLAKKVSDGEDWAIRFTLLTLGKDDGFTERQEIAGPDGGPVPIQYIEVVRDANSDKT